MVVESYRTKMKMSREKKNAIILAEFGRPDQNERMFRMGVLSISDNEANTISARTFRSVVYLFSIFFFLVLNYGRPVLIDFILCESIIIILW